MANTVFFLDAGALALIAARYRSARPSVFSGTVTDDGLGLAIVYDTGVPTVDLATTLPGKNIGFHFGAVQLTSYAWKDGQRGAELSSLTAAVDVGCVVGSSGGQLQLGAIEATGATLADKLVAALCNHKIVPQVAAAVSSLPMPDLSKLTGLAVSFVGLSVTGGRVRIDANVGSSTDVPDVTLAPGPAASVVCAIAASAVSELANQGASFPATADKSDSGDLGRFLPVSWSVDAHASADSLGLSISNDSASASISVDAGVSGKIEGLGPDIDVPVTSPSVDVTLSTDGSDAKVAFQLPLPPTWSPSIPDALSEIAGSIGSVLGALGNLLEDSINDKLANATVTMFTLPDSVSAFGVSVTPAWWSLSWDGNCAHAVISLT